MNKQKKKHLFKKKSTLRLRHFQFTISENGTKLNCLIAVRKQIY